MKNKINLNYVTNHKKYAMFLPLITMIYFFKNIKNHLFERHITHCISESIIKHIEHRRVNLYTKIEIGNLIFYTCSTGESLESFLAENMFHFMDH